LQNLVFLKKFIETLNVTKYLEKEGKLGELRHQAHQK